MGSIGCRATLSLLLKRFEMSIWTILVLFWGVVCSAAIGVVVGGNLKK